MTGTLMDSLVKSAEHLNKQFVGTTESVMTRRVAIERVDINNITLRFTEKDYDTSVMYGVAVYGTNTYSSSLSFILGDPNRAILGTTELGGGQISEIVSRVINKNNTFIEKYNHSDFIDTTNSTGSYVAGSYTLASAEILQSEVIAKNNQIYTSAVLSIEGTDIADDTFYLSGDGGSTWEVVTNGTEHTFSTSSTAGIKYKIINEGSSTFPLSFPSSFNEGTTSTITEIQMRYS